MKIWLDAQLSPAIATWMEGAFEIDTVLAVQLDPEDRDFVDLLERLGPPPPVIWITCGNTSNRSMRRILSEALPRALQLVREGEPLVEISDLD